MFSLGISPKFAAMMQRCEDEGRDDYTMMMEINEADPATVEQMLEFIYMGEFSQDPLTDDMGIRLLHCAQQYEILSLEKEILKRMSVSGTISAENDQKFMQAMDSCKPEKEAVTDVL